MAKPQLEDGHTKIANELMDAFCRSFPGGSQAQILLAIIRKTYGWHKKEDSISITQLCEATGLSRRSVINGLQNLEAMKMLIVKRQRGRGNVNLINTISLQKNYELWVVQRKSPQYEKQLQNQRVTYQQEVVQRKEGSAKIGKEVVQRNEENSEFFAPTKERKKYIQKKVSIYTPLFIKFFEVYPRKEAKMKASLAFNAAIKERTNGHTEETFTDMLIVSVNKAKESKQWKENIIPHPATWLNGKRWEDEITVPLTEGKVYKEL